MKRKLKRWNAIIILIAVLLCGLAAPELESRAAGSPSVTYAVHMQRLGDMPRVTSVGKKVKTAGLAGGALRMENIRIGIKGASGLHVQYRTHVQSAGWLPWVSDNEPSGTAGLAKRIEAIQIRLSGEKAASYDIYYRVYTEGFGWLAWTKNGNTAGSAGIARRIEAVQIALLDKKSTPPSSLGSRKKAFIGNQTPAESCNPEKPHLIYAGHQQRVGNLAPVSDGAVLGVTGQALRLEAFSVRLTNLNATGFAGSGVSYRAHVQGVGWQQECANGMLAGSVGIGKRVEAYSIRLTGSIEKSYDIYYRTHVQGYGWLDWAKNGQQTGSMGFSLRTEALQVLLVKKGNPAPGPTAKIMLTDEDIKYFGWIERGGKYYFYDRTTGIMQKGGTQAGITLNADGSAVITEYSRNKIRVMIRAHEVVNSITSPGDSKEEKMMKCYRYVVSFPYMLKHYPFYEWKDRLVCPDAVVANNILNAFGDQTKPGGDCVSEAAALAYLFAELGLKDVYLHVSGHGWVSAEGRYWDPNCAAHEKLHGNDERKWIDMPSYPAESPFNYRID